MPVAGVDIGSLTAKAVVLEGSDIKATSLVLTGHNSKLAGRRALDLALEQAGLAEDGLDSIVATGYGRLAADFTDEKVTEITCHARGAHFTTPEARTVIDLGGQDSKAIAIDAGGKVLDFVMNDKCSAGTGRFLEVMAHALEKRFDSKILVPEMPQHTGALGAAIIAGERAECAGSAEGAAGIDQTP